MNTMRCCVAILLLSPALTDAAELRLAALFSDHMVLQRDKPVSVWGWGDPGERVQVSFAGQEKTGTANADGKWLVKLDPLAADAKSQVLRVRSDSRAAKVQVSDVLVGEAWLGSGQSNMAMAVSRARDFPKEQSAATLPLIRMFTETSKGAAAPQADGHGTWVVCAPDTVGKFSATLFFFGREVHRQLGGVPIGLINSSVGGTPIESWIAAEVQAAVPQLKASVAAEGKAFTEFDEAKAKAAHEKALALWQERARKAKTAGQPPPKKPLSPIETRARRAGPGGLFNGKIAPLAPYTLRGILWYQGEANSNGEKAELYQYQLPALVSDWRRRWGEELPFAWVQLPNFNRPGDGWPIVQEAMLKSLKLPHTGMAITIDIGDPNDIHPTYKQEFGRRLALWALADVYGKRIPSSGPLPTGHEVRGSEMRITFSHCDGDLTAKGDVLKGFAVAGADRQWKPAQARIEGDAVIVSNPAVASPVAVRYAWASNPDGSLYNGSGLPASPFRTDDWPVEIAARPKR